MQWIKVLELSLQHLRLLLWCDSWCRNFLMPQVQPEKKKSLAWENSKLPGEFAVCSSQHWRTSPWPLFLRTGTKHCSQLWMCISCMCVFKNLSAIPFICDPREGQSQFIQPLWKNGTLTSILPAHKHSRPNHIMLAQPSIAFYFCDSPGPTLPTSSVFL